MTWTGSLHSRHSRPPGLSRCSLGGLLAAQRQVEGLVSRSPLTMSQCLDGGLGWATGTASVLRAQVTDC